MKYILPLYILLLYTNSLPAQKKMETVFEKSNGRQTGTYQETIQYYTALSHFSPYIKMKEMAKTDSGYPLHLVILDIDQQFDLKQARDKGKTIVLINNGIHPGEPDGIEASQMLLRDYAIDKGKREKLRDIILAIIPIYNIGGALNRNETTRVNQNGPEAYGFRGNAQNFDLNRDFIKADTKNTRAFYGIYHLLQPDIFIDTHVSNGADYQYSITHLATQHNKIGGEMGKYIHNEFTPKLERKMTGKGSEITPYVNVFNTTPDAEGIIQFMDYPRYTTGYTALFNTLGFMIETHMLKPFDIRVKATYNFLESILELAAEDGKRIRTLHIDNGLKPGDLEPIDWEIDKSSPEMINFKGYKGEMINSKVTSQKRLYFNREKPFTKQIPYYNTFAATKKVLVPQAYVIPQGWHNVIDRLKWNNIHYQQFNQDTMISVEAYRIEKYQTASSAYEGHYPHSNVEVTKEKKSIKFRNGDYIFFVGRQGGRFLLETLEPQAPDSYFNWNFFDTILQQKEHFSPYVFEDVAAKMLENNPELQTSFDKKKKEDGSFSDNGYAQLDYIYKHSPHYEWTHMNYPVYRLVD